MFKMRVDLLSTQRIRSTGSGFWRSRFESRMAGGGYICRDLVCTVSAYLGCNCLLFDVRGGVDMHINFIDCHVREW